MTGFVFEHIRECVWEIVCFIIFCLDDNGEKIRKHFEFIGDLEKKIETTEDKIQLWAWHELCEFCEL